MATSLSKSSQLTIVEPAVEDAINCGPLTPMRLGGPLLFSVPMAFAIWMKRLLGARILIFVATTTFATHQPRKAWTQTLREDLDLVAVGLWYLYNTFVTFEVAVGFATHGYTEIGYFY